MELRHFEESDTKAVISLIDGIYQSYGFRIHLEGAESDLADVSAHFEPELFQVLVDDRTIRGTVALGVDPDRENEWFLKRLYLDPDLHGGGWADALLDWAVSEARSRGGRRLNLWSDVLFERAHAFYSKREFERAGEPRSMDDGWAPYQEYFYTREL